MKTALGYRRNASPEEPGIAVMDKHARQVAEEFYEQFAKVLVRVPESLHPYLSWLPDLPLRLFGILPMSKTIERLLNMKPTGAAQEPPKPDPKELQAAMQQAVRWTRWLCQEHYRLVCSSMDAASTDSTEQATDSTDMATLEEGILTKLKDNGPQEPRDLLRCFHDFARRGPR